MPCLPVDMGWWVLLLPGIAAAPAGMPNDHRKAAQIYKYGALFADIRSRHSRLDLWVDSRLEANTDLCDFWLLNFSILLLTGCTLQLVTTSGINPNGYRLESNWGSVGLMTDVAMHGAMCLFM